MSHRADGKQLCCRFRTVLAELKPGLTGENLAIWALCRPKFSYPKLALVEYETNSGRYYKKVPNSPGGAHGVTAMKKCESNE